jgi:hypothetical protein
MTDWSSGSAAGIDTVRAVRADDGGSCVRSFAVMRTR